MLRDLQVINKFLGKDGRWYITLSESWNGNKTMSNAVYIWLLGNPSFLAIPKGYVIHHLDKDNQNDDVSNLVIMQKHHHAAHHFKTKTIQPKIDIDPGTYKIKRTIFYPIREPRIYNGRPGRYRIYFNEKIDGKCTKKFIDSWEDQPITTMEMAEKVKAEIWQNKPILQP